MRSRSWPLRRQRVQVGLVAVALGDHDLDERDALDQLRGQHARRRVVAVDARDPLMSIAARMLPEQDRLAGLDQVVDLVGGPAGELVDDLAAPRRRRTGATQSSSQVTPYIRSMSACSVSRMPRALDLDGDASRRCGGPRGGPGRSRRPRRTPARTTRRSTLGLVRPAPGGRSRGPRRTGTARPGSAA